MQLEETAKSVLGMYQKAIASADLLPSDKEDLSARACTFADMCGSAAMQEAAERLHAARWASLHHHLHRELVIFSETVYQVCCPGVVCDS